MRNYSGKSNKPMTRYRTPSRFKVRQAELFKKSANVLNKDFNSRRFKKSDK